LDSLLDDRQLRSPKAPNCCNQTEPVSWYQLVGCRASDEEEEQQPAALKASPKSTEGDNLMVIRLVAVDHAEVAQ
jgi:hypothetical protein